MDNERLGVIYKITNRINGKCYIGQTINFENRKRTHLNPTHKYSIHYAFDKYGVDNFDWEIIEKDIPQSKLNEREIYWIAYYDSYHNGYNQTEGGSTSNGFDTWREQHPNEVLEVANKNLEKAQQYWIEHPEEAKAQKTRAQQAMAQARRKKVRCIELNLIFESVTAASNWTKSEENPNGHSANVSCVSAACRGKRKMSAGYHWEFV